MNLFRLARIGLGAVTAWPVIYLAVWATTTFIWMAAGGVHGGSVAMLLLRVLIGILEMQIATAVLAAGLVVFYLGYVLVAAPITGWKAAVWGFALIVANVFAMPVFYWRFIRRKEPEHGSPGDKLV